MYNLFFIALGGAAGTLLRYFVSGIVHRFTSGSFPAGTLLINLAGSFIIGFLWGLFEESSLPPALRLFLFIGVLGGFTTFSSYALESFNLLKDGELGTAAVNILVSNIAGIGLVFSGFMLAKLIILNIKGV